jgi:IS5 family transposase
MIRHQQPLMQAFIDHEHAAELQAVAEILDASPAALALVERDLVEGRRRDVGRPGMTAEQVLRALIVKQMNGYSYDELAFHLADSVTYRAFCCIGSFDVPPSKSTLQENIKRLQAETLETINRMMLRHAFENDVEDGSTIRGDCTVVPANIHAPRDSLQLWDTVRVLVRLMAKGRGYGVQFTSHRRRAKRRAMEIGQADKADKRRRLYRDLLTVTENTIADAEKAASLLANRDEERAHALAAELLQVCEIGRLVVEQTRLRVMDGEQVPSSEKIVSIFEPHTDIIVKGRRETEYGHKICLTTGVSSMVLDCQILEGNAADSTLTSGVIERHRCLYGVAPREAAFDGAFASRPNVRALKEMGVEEVAFSKRRGLELHEMVSDIWTYKRLRNFRAGIESVISFLKRCFGLARCLWSGFASFRSYVWSSILSANLLILARHRIAG